MSSAGVIASAAVCAWFGSEISFKDQWPLYDALRTTSAIILAILGAWVSVLYPSALQKVFRKDEVFNARDEQSIRLMLQNIRISTCILGAVMAAGVAAPILKQFEFLLPHVPTVRRLSFSVVGGLTFLQFWTLLMTLAQAHLAESDLKVAAKHATWVRGLRRNVQTQPDEASKI